MVRTILALSLQAVAGFSQMASTQTVSPTVSIGGTEIELGQPAPQMISALQQKNFTVTNYDKTPAPPVRSWFVFRKQPAQLLGVLYVKNDVIVGVGSQVSVDTAQDAFSAFYEISSKLSKEAHVCGFSPWADYSSDPNVGGPRTVASVLIVCRDTFSSPPFIVRFEREQYNDGSISFSIWEDLGKTK
jgi:hypothetical protein